jgi:hypothetical protein
MEKCACVDSCRLRKERYVVCGNCRVTRYASTKCCHQDRPNHVEACKRNTIRTLVLRAIKFGDVKPTVIMTALSKLVGLNCRQLVELLDSGELCHVYFGQKKLVFQVVAEWLVTRHFERNCACSYTSLEHSEIPSPQFTFTVADELITIATTVRGFTPDIAFLVEEYASAQSALICRSRGRYGSLCGWNKIVGEVSDRYQAGAEIKRPLLRQRERHVPPITLYEIPFYPNLRRYGVREYLRDALVQELKNIETVSLVLDYCHVKSVEAATYTAREYTNRSEWFETIEKAIGCVRESEYEIRQYFRRFQTPIYQCVRCGRSGSATDRGIRFSKTLFVCLRKTQESSGRRKKSCYNAVSNFMMSRGDPGLPPNLGDVERYLRDNPEFVF